MIFWRLYTAKIMPGATFGAKCEHDIDIASIMKNSENNSKYHNCNKDWSACEAVHRNRNVVKVRRMTVREARNDCFYSK